ncbi:zinc finger MYM-type protein 1-like [Zingiber officinale]|uniref:zinc finger MYM-type protein 1-like n=1 Tax=Zingiber officinale TaxID=94328 RepID=UPI001C4BF0D0|nr:zinc finger MYM-type protein 1-like [Zingiber officinale]
MSMPTLGGRVGSIRSPPQVAAASLSSRRRRERRGAASSVDEEGSARGEAKKRKGAMAHQRRGESDDGTSLPMKMLKYFAKKPRSSIESSSVPDEESTPAPQPSPPPPLQILFENIGNLSHKVEIVANPSLQKLIEEYDIGVRDQVATVVGMNALGNNQMIAPKIQKQLVNSCAVETTNAILVDLGDRWFTLLLDEARDCSVKEKMAVVIRYVNKHGQLIERFMVVVHVGTTTASCLKEAIDSLFAKYGFSVARLRGQGYDGASNMSGEFIGLKALIMKENPYVLYVHCFAHQLQLVIVAVAQENQYICDFMWIVGSVVNTSASSCKRADKLRQLEHDRKVKLLERGEISSGRGLNQETSLARPGDTRWGSHHSTLCRIEQMWPYVIKVLQNLIDDVDRSSKGLSRTLVERMERYEFVFILRLMKHILAITNHLSTVLQEKDQNIANAMCLINNVNGKL